MSSEMKNLLKTLLAFLVLEDVLALDNSYHNSLAKVCHKIELPSDLLFILDGSGSVGGPNFDSQINILNRIVDTVAIGPNDTQIAVLQYSSYTYIEFGFAAYSTKESLRAAISQLQHRSGTTKTGKALDKALQLFTSRAWGSRFGKNGVQQIAIVVSDGHSRDDPGSSAARLRQAGIKIIALGIGRHINMKELQDLTNDPRHAFESLAHPNTMEQFVEAFKQTTITDECEFLRGPEGAQITCHPDSFGIEITTEKNFEGVLFVEDHFDDPKCKLQTNSTDFELRVELLNCGVHRQFLINPRGFAFATTVVLQFHPVFTTSLDRRFNVHCFYQDNEANALDWQLIKEHTQRKNKDDTKMPCEYSIESVGKKDECDKNLFIGEEVIHKWNCSVEHFDVYQTMFIRNCEFVDLRTNSVHELIDENGCSVEPGLIETPQYTSPVSASARGVIFRRPDSHLGKIRCHLQFCDRLMSECDRVPSKCHLNKREAGFAVGIRPLTWDASPPLVTFGRLEKQKMASKRRRPDLDQSVGAVIFTRNEIQRPQARDVKLTTQDFKIIDTNLPSGQDIPQPKKVVGQSTEKNIENGSDKSAGDPFQEQEHEQASSGVEDKPGLSETILNKLTTDQILIESRILNIQTSQNLSCRFRN